MEEEGRTEVKLITNPVHECRKEQKRYNRCIKKHAIRILGANAAGSEECLELFDDFQDCVLGAVEVMKEQHKQKSSP